MRTLVSCLALAVGAFAVTASGGAGAMAGAVAIGLAGGVAANLATELFKLGDRRVAERFLDGFHGIDENHDIARALRLAQLHALRAVLVRFDKARVDDPDPARQATAKAFSAALTRFLDSEIGLAQGNAFASAPGLAADEATIRNAVIKALPDGFDATLAAQRDGERMADIADNRRTVKFAVEAGVLEEIRIRTAAVDGGPPALFLEAFHGDERNDGWFDLFVRDAADDLKEGGKFELAWNAEQIALIKAIQAAQSEALATIKGDTTTIRADTSTLRAGQERIEAGTERIEALVAKLLEAQTSGLRAADQEGVREREIIALARRIAADVQDFDQARRELERAVEVAIDVQREGREGSNAGDFVDLVLKRVAALSRESKYDEAATVAQDSFAKWQAEEEERRQAAVQQGVTLARAGLNQDLLRRDAASAASWVARIVDLEAPDPAARFDALLKAQDEWYERGRDKGLNLDLNVSIEIARLCDSRATDRDEHAAALNSLGAALATLGERESGRARLEEAVAAYRASLAERTRERVPLDWAMTQTNLGAALSMLGERESGTAKFEEAVAAYRAALEERPRERAPLDWAMTQTNLGLALWRLGERESGTARLEEAVAAHRAALEERTRERAPLAWATTHINLGAALQTLGERESGTARLEEAVAAYRAAMEELTRERVPLDWATTQTNLGLALWRLGERESGTARLEEAVAAFRAALEERTRERSPPQWATTQINLGGALQTLGERESGTARIEEAVAAYRAALEECTRERAALDWAMTQNNLGAALSTLGEREGGMVRLKEAVAACRAALEERTRERVPLQWAGTQMNLGNALSKLGEREGGTARLEEAVAAYRAALQERTRERAAIGWARSTGDMGVVRVTLAERTADLAVAEAALADIETAHATMEAVGHGPYASYYDSQLPRARALVARLRGA